MDLQETFRTIFAVFLHFSLIFVLVFTYTTVVVQATTNAQQLLSVTVFSAVLICYVLLSILYDRVIRRLSTVSNNIELLSEKLSDTDEDFSETQR